jgi:hypothetical protein
VAGETCTCQTFAKSQNHPVNSLEVPVLEERKVSNVKWHGFYRRVVSNVSTVWKDRTLWSHWRNTRAAKKTRVQQNSAHNGGTLSECTPHLRHLALASTDVQGAGNLNSSRGSILCLVYPSRPTPASATGEATLIFNYRTCLARNAANQQAGSELASFLWVLSHEKMSLDD